MKQGWHTSGPGRQVPGLGDGVVMTQVSSCFPDKVQILEMAAGRLGDSLVLA